jgi:uncharacterized protein YidB (DUF937 family)
MGLLDGVLGGVVGAEVATIVNRVIQQHGGLPGIIQQFEAQGLGPTIKSWISNGPNHPITPEQVHQAVGADSLQQMAAKLGINPQELAEKLAQVLPAAIDKLTPNGTLPTG